MIFRFKLTTPERPDFFQEIDIEGDNTLFDFHTFLQKSLNYDSAQQVFFHAADQRWNVKRSFSLLGQNGSELMDETSLRSLVRTQFHRLLYEFDVHNHRSFKVELSGMEEPDSRTLYPTVHRYRGDAPIQIGKEKSTFSSIFDQAMPDFDADMYANTDGASSEE